MTETTISENPVLPSSVVDDVSAITASRAEDTGLNSLAPFDPETVTPLRSKADLFMSAGQQWLDAGEIKDEKTASYMSDYISGLLSLHKSIEGERKRQKGIFDEQGQKVQDAFSPIVSRLKIAGQKARPLLDDYLKKVEAQVREQARLAAEEADRKAAEAERKAAEAAENNDLDAIAEAQEQAAAAEKARKAAVKQGNAKVNAKSATGQGRTVARRKAPATAEITNIKLAFMTYAKHPKLAETLVSLAQADARRADGPKSIPGFKITKE